MAPVTQLKETVADVQEGIRAILLGPPGAGKGTQVGAGGAAAAWLIILGYYLLFPIVQIQPVSSHMRIFPYGVRANLY